MRFLLCNYAFAAQGKEVPVDFHLLDETMVALGFSDLRGPWMLDAIPRIIKTHQPYRRWLFRVPRRAVYLQRDPRDVMVSYYHFLQNHTRVRFSGAFADFLRHPQFGLEAYFAHWSSWRTRTPILIRYEDLRRDPAGTFSGLLSALGGEPVESFVQAAVERSSISRVRALQDATGLSGESRFRPGFNFARDGRSRQWPEFFETDDITLYTRLCDRHDFQDYSMGHDV